MADGFVPMYEGKIERFLQIQQIQYHITWNVLHMNSIEIEKPLFCLWTNGQGVLEIGTNTCVINKPENCKMYDIYEDQVIY
jgi:hypothetical protein